MELYGEIREWIHPKFDPTEIGEPIEGRVYVAVYQSSGPFKPGVPRGPRRPVYRGYFYGGYYSFSVEKSSYDVQFWSRGYCGTFHYDVKVEEDTELNALLRPSRPTW